MMTLSPQNILVESLRLLELQGSSAYGWILTVPEVCFYSTLEVQIQKHLPVDLRVTGGERLEARPAPAPRPALLFSSSGEKLRLGWPTHLFLPADHPGLPIEGLLLLWDGPREAWRCRSDVLLRRQRAAYRTGSGGFHLRHEDTIKVSNFHAIFLENQ